MTEGGETGAEARALGLGDRRALRGGLSGDRDL